VGIEGKFTFQSNFDGSIAAFDFCMHLLPS
jgi:hypothetical protein